VDRYEVIVVDDGSTDGTPSIADMSYRFELHYIRQMNQGDANARNSGAKRAKGRYLVFVDDDIRIEKKCLDAFAAALQANDRAIVVGHLKPVLPDPPQTFHRHIERAFPRRGMHSTDAKISFTECKSGFMTVRRDDYLDIGMMKGLNKHGANAWCDVDFGYRAHQKGYDFYRCSDAIGYHYDGALQDFQSFCDRCEKSGELGMKLFDKHPSLRGKIDTFVDKEPISLSCDHLGLIVSKVFRAFTAWEPVLAVMEQQVRILERFMPSSILLPMLYRWTMSSYIYRGYRRALNQEG
jgi:glycosyltransferase involved in cell wall biosynthesis